MGHEGDVDVTTKGARVIRETLHDVLNDRERGIKSAEGGVDVGYGKWWARIRGPHVLIAIIIVLALVPGVYLQMQHDTEAKAAQVRIEQAIQKSNETQEAILWVNSLPEEARMKLNLSKPHKIMEMQRDNYRP